MASNISPHGSSESLLVAVSYITTFSGRNNNSIIIGTFLCSNQDILLNDLRNLLPKQLPALPSSFSFLSKERWPISNMHEKSIKINQVLDKNNILYICRKFDDPAVGVKWYSTSIGFIFVNLNYSLKKIRIVILKELRKSVPKSFIFVDQKRRWPITYSQENQLIGWDIIHQGSLVLNMPHNSLQLPNTTLKNSAKKQKIDCGEDNVDLSVEERRKSLPSLNFNKDIDILISYVRAESYKHARALKTELSDLGFNVFLDIDEILPGGDWQDALNDAVKNCAIFVPLITPQYGLTRWTNREIKLADLMEKHIVPVNFLDYWPPDCLNIQFSSLQYVPWKTIGELEKAKASGEEEERAKDARFWDYPYVHRTAKSIEVSCRRITKTDSISPALFRNPTLRSYPSPISEEFAVIKQPRSGPPLIVISVHPKQQNIANELKTLLMNRNMEVWCSIDDLEKEQSEDSCSLSGESLTPTTPIVVAAHSHSPCFVGGHTENNIGTFKKIPTLKFSYSVENGTLGFSQFSDSQNSAATPESNRLKQFKSKVDDAGVVIIVLSQSYCGSRTSFRQVFYCEHRKCTIIIKTKDFHPPARFTNLLGPNIIEYSKKEECLNRIKEEVKIALNSPQIISKSKHEENKIQSMVEELSIKLKKSHCVYITGNTKLRNAKTEDICHAIGQELATIKSLILFTGGFYGVSDLVGRSFCEERELLGEKPARIYHILPKYDTVDYSQKARQNSDGSFQKVPFGKTYFIGNSVEERREVVTRVFDICILIEGGPRAACEVQEFVWNDKTIIPVISTGGAASGKFETPERILEVPPCVNAEDWLVLSKQDVIADDVARAVKRIVCSLIKSCSPNRKDKNKFINKLKETPPQQIGNFRSMNSITVSHKQDK